MLAVGIAIGLLIGILLGALAGSADRPRRQLYGPVVYDPGLWRWGRRREK